MWSNYLLAQRCTLVKISNNKFFFSPRVIHHRVLQNCLSSRWRSYSYLYCEGKKFYDDRYISLDRYFQRIPSRLPSPPSSRFRWNAAIVKRGGREGGLNGPLPVLEITEHCSNYAVTEFQACEQPKRKSPPSPRLTAATQSSRSRLRFEARPPASGYLGIARRWCVKCVAQNHGIVSGKQLSPFLILNQFRRWYSPYWRWNSREENFWSRF